MVKFANCLNSLKTSILKAWSTPINWPLLRMNFYNHHIRSIFKSHSISVTFKFCAVRIALCTLEPRSTDSLGTQHRAIFHALIITTPSIQARCVHIIIGDIFNILNTFLLILWLHYIMALKYMRNNKLLTLLFIKEGLCCNM